MSHEDIVILATAGYDHQIKLWQARSGMNLRTFEHPDSQVNSLAITPDNMYLAAAGYQHIRMYDLQSNNPNSVANYDDTQKNVTGVVFRSDGKWFASCGEDGIARIWDHRARNVPCSKMQKVTAPLNCICLHPNQRELFIGDQDGYIWRWETRNDKLHKVNDADRLPDTSILSLDIDMQASMLAATNNKGKCYIWSLNYGRDDLRPTELRSSQVINAHQRQALKCRFSPDSTLLATSSADNTVCVWRTADLARVAQLKSEQQRWVWDCAFSNDSQYLFSVSSDQLLRLWEVDTAKCCRQYTGHSKAITSLAFKEIVF